jgi:DNA-binding transcriptional LysR family regulator
VRAHHYRLLDYFACVVDHGSMAAAARALHVSTPVVSKAISDLEHAVGETLLLRSRGGQQLTDTGALVYQESAQMQQAAERALAMSTNFNDDLQGRVHVTAPTEIASVVLSPLLLQLRDTHPGITVEVSARDDLVRISDSQCDLAIRAIARGTESATTDSLSSSPLVFVAAPELLQGLAAQDRRSLTRSIKALPFIGFTRRSDNSRFIGRHGKTGKQVTLQATPVVFADNALACKAYALAGLGVAQLMEVSVHNEVRSGALVRLGAEVNFGSVDLDLVYRDRYPAAPARLLAAVLLEHLNTDRVA